MEKLYRPTPLEIIKNMRDKNFREEIILEEVEKELNRLASNGERKEENITIEIVDEEKQIASFKVDGKETCKFAYFTEEQFEALQPKSPIQSRSVSPVAATDPEISEAVKDWCKEMGEAQKAAMSGEEMKKKIEELVEATLVIGVRRGSHEGVPHEDAVALIGSSTINLTERFQEIFSQYAASLVTQRDDRIKGFEMLVKHLERELNKLRGEQKEP